METITFGFSKPKTWKPFAWLIMTAYSIPYSHSYIKIYSDKYDRWIIYQASSTMVNFMNMETFNEEAQVFQEFEIPVVPDQRSKIMQFAIDSCGKPYGVKEIFGMAWVRINELCKRNIQNPFSDKDRTLVCSELTSIILRDCLGIVLPKNSDDMTPLDVHVLIESIIKNNLTDNNT